MNWPKKMKKTLTKQEEFGLFEKDPDSLLNYYNQENYKDRLNEELENKLCDRYIKEITKNRHAIRKRKFGHNDHPLFYLFRYSFH